MKSSIVQILHTDSVFFCHSFLFFSSLLFFSLLFSSSLPHFLFPLYSSPFLPQHVIDLISSPPTSPLSFVSSPFILLHLHSTPLLSCLSRYCCYLLLYTLYFADVLRYSAYRRYLFLSMFYTFSTIFRHLPHFFIFLVVFFSIYCNSIILIFMRHCTFSLSTYYKM